MSTILLASVSLFALAVNSRPTLASGDSGFIPSSSMLQTSIQAPFQINSGKNDLISDTPRFHFQILSEESFVALAENAHAENNFDAHDETRSEDVSDDAAPPELVTDTRYKAPTNDSPSTPLVVLAFSCVAALLALAFVASTLCIVKLLWSQMFVSKTVWDLIPPFRRCRISQENISASAKQHFSGEGCLLLHAEIKPLGLDVEAGTVQRPELHPGDKSLYFDAVSDIESEWDDVDEKYQDALDVTPLALIHSLPLENNVSQLDHPPLPPVGCYPLYPPTSDRGTPLMRESCLSPSPISRPAWSVRATDSPALGLSSCHGVTNAIPQSLIHPRRRAYRAPVPEFDIALAMQLRPGFGSGADAAWMIRFLMTIFGWFAVALTGNA